MTTPSSIFSCPGFRFEYIAVDVMHCGDLGCFQDFIGGVMHVEMSHKPFHRSQQAGVDWLNQQLEGFYSANRGLSQLHLTVGMLKPKDSWPSLKSKAAECRHLAKFALVLAHRHARMPRCL